MGAEYQFKSNFIDSYAFQIIDLIILLLDVVYDVRIEAQLP